MRTKAAALFACLGAGCSAPSGPVNEPPPSPPVIVLTVGPAANALSIGDSLQLWTTLNIAPAPVIWSSSDTLVATVSPSGMLRAVGTGKAQVLATIPAYGIAGPLPVVVDE